MRFDSDMSLLISASIIKKSSGPKTVPCSTPLSTGESSLIAPGSLTKWDRLVRKLNNNNIYLKSNIQCTYRYEFSGLYNNNIQLQ